MSKRRTRAAQLIVATIVLSAAFAAAENVTVIPVPTVIGPHLRLTVSLHGQPVKDVKVSFYSDKNELMFVRLSNPHGMVTLPLRPGVYRIEAQAPNDVVSSLVVKVVKKAKADTLTLDLTPEFEAHQAWLAEAEQMPIAATVNEFSGAIFDPGNAPIPNADIRVVRRGMEFADKVVLQLKSDADGKFSAQLEPGEYIAFFSESGFATKIVPFAITKQGEGALRVVLNVMSVTETTEVSAEEPISASRNY